MQLIKQKLDQGKDLPERCVPIFFPIQEVFLDHGIALTTVHLYHI